MTIKTPADPREMVLALAQFDADYGRAVINALDNQERHMRESAAECQQALDGTAPPRPVIRLDAGQVQRFRETADELAKLLRPPAHARSAQAGAAALLALVRELILPEPPEPDGEYIIVNPTRDGVEHMAALFTEQAARANAVRDAWEALAEAAEKLAGEIC